MKFYKYHGAGNDFLIADNRKGAYKLTTEKIAWLCDRHIGLGADGLMLLEKSSNHDFKMVYYNSDGSSGMMCGNGGRCIVAFAADLGFQSFNFDCVDTQYKAELLSSGREKIIRLRMKDIPHYGIKGSSTYFINTGAYHFVKFVENLDEMDVVSEGRKIRYSEDFMPIGTNVNFVQSYPNYLKIRTYEKGVENETLACGTGIVASALAAYAKGIEGIRLGERVKYEVKARISDLSVDFIPSFADGYFSVKDLWLTGPATFVAEMDVAINL